MTIVQLKYKQLSAVDILVLLAPGYPRIETIY
jgi:hypothetical protein